MSIEFWINRICLGITAVFVLAGFWHHGEVKANIARSQAEGRASSICFKSGGTMKDGECLWDQRIERLQLEVGVQDIQLSGVRAELERCEGDLYEERISRNVCARVEAVEEVVIEGQR